MNNLSPDYRHASIRAVLKAQLTLLAAASLLLLAPMGASRAEEAPPPPSEITYQGELLDAEGAPLEGPVSIGILLFDEPEEGTLLYSERHPEVPLVDGVFSIVLGKGLEPDGIFGPRTFASVRPWVEVTVDGETLSPRQPFTSVAYALHSESSNSVGSIETTEIVTNSTLAQSFATEVTQIDESQVPESIPRNTDLEAERAARRAADESLRRTIEALRERIAFLEECSECGGGGSVHGLKWLDIDANGERDPNEPGLPGVVIYSDTNLNGEIDGGEPRTVTMQDDPDTAVDETGRYWLEDLLPGNHVIREVVPDGLRQTFPPPGEHYVVLEPGSVVDGVDFGNAEEERGSVRGVKWLDRNGNGERDADEPGLPGVVIYSDLNGNGEFDPGAEPAISTFQDDPNTAFDESGQYWLTGLRPGEHVIREVVPEGFRQTFPPTLLHSVNVAGGSTIDGLDFGNAEAP